MTTCSPSAEPALSAAFVSATFESAAAVVSVPALLPPHPVKERPISAAMDNAAACFIFIIISSCHSL